MSLFDRLGMQPAPQQRTQQDAQRALQEIQQDPEGVLQRTKGFRIPAGMRTPEQIIPYLLQSRQITESDILTARKTVGI